MVAMFGALTLVGAPQGSVVKVDVTKSTNAVEFLTTASPGGMKIHGELSKDADAKPATGSVTLKEEVLSADLKLKLDAFDTGIGLRNKHMKEKYLETAKYPESTLSIESVNLTGKTASGDKVAFTGKLNLHGQTAPVSGKAGVTVKGDNLELELEWEVPLKDFAIEVPTFMGIRVSDKVAVRAQLQAVTHAATSSP
jgi:polyisoprenoid-binding protein YceI